MGFKVFICVTLLIATTYAAPYTETTSSPEDIANIIPLCRRSDPHINECIKNATIALRDKVKEGIPALNFPSLEPLKIPTIKLEQSTDALTYKAVLMDIVFHGLSDYEFKDIETNMENFTVMGTAFFNHVYLETEYMIMGNYQMLPIEGSGRLMANFTDNVAKITMMGTLVKRNGEFYFMNHDTQVTVKVGDAKARFTDLYSGSDDKSKIAEHIVNMHSEEILEELQPAVETVLSMLVDDIASKFFSSSPFNKLFPE